MGSSAAVIRTIRPPFLILAPVCVFLGVCTAVASHAVIDPVAVFLIVIGAISSAMSVNTFNEYFDFKSGLDFITEKTPFSGGSGSLPSNPHLAVYTQLIAFASLMLTILIGLYFMFAGGMAILPIGILGVLIIVTYTQWLNHQPWFCLFTPGLGFGVLMVVGTHVLLSGEHHPLPWLLSAVPFLLFNNLLLLNQYPDIEADKSVGRKTFPIVYGVQRSTIVYASFVTLTFGLILAYIAMDVVPLSSSIALLPLLLSIYSLSGMTKLSGDIAQSPVYMATNVGAAILTPLLLGVALLLGAFIK